MQDRDTIERPLFQRIMTEFLDPSKVREPRERVLLAWMSSLPMPQAQTTQIQHALDRLFTLFDADSNGVVDTLELCVGLSVLLGGDFESKVCHTMLDKPSPLHLPLHYVQIRAAFDLFDYNKDGYISREEMIRYLASVYHVVKDTQGDLFQQVG